MFKYFLILFIFITACNSNQQEEVISLDDLTGHSDRYNEDSLKKNGQDNVDKVKVILPEFLQRFADSTQLSNENFNIVDSTTFTDRFGADSTLKIIWSKTNNMDNNIFEQSSLFYWHYKDSTRCTNAFYNWLDCFGKSCKSLKVKDNKNLQKDFASIWVSEKEIYYLSSNENYKISDLENLFNREKKLTWKYILVQNKNSAAKWFMYDDKNKLIIAK